MIYLIDTGLELKKTLYPLMSMTARAFVPTYQLTYYLRKLIRLIKAAFTHAVDLDI